MHDQQVNPFLHSRGHGHVFEVTLDLDLGEARISDVLDGTAEPTVMPADEILVAGGTQAGKTTLLELPGRRDSVGDRAPEFLQTPVN
jgi:hypothetical protein